GVVALVRVFFLSVFSADVLVDERCRVEEDCGGGGGVAGAAAGIEALGGAGGVEAGATSGGFCGGGLGVGELWCGGAAGGFGGGVGAGGIYGALVRGGWARRGGWLYWPAAVAGAAAIMWPGFLSGTAVNLNAVLRPLNVALLVGVGLGGGAVARGLARRSV